MKFMYTNGTSCLLESGESQDLQQNRISSWYSPLLKDDTFFDIFADVLEIIVEMFPVPLVCEPICVQKIKNESTRIIDFTPPPELRPVFRVLNIYHFYYPD